MNTVTENSASPSILNAYELRQAFLVFDNTSRQLADSYSELQNEVARLNAEVVTANGCLREQLREKQALAERLTGLLAALPAGVLVLDAAGIVTEVNAAARTFLGEPLIGQAWTAVIAGRLRLGEAPHEWQVVQGKRCIALSVRELASGSGRIVVATDMTEQHEMSMALVRSQRLAAMGAMTASLAHQLRTPLASALLYASQLSQPMIPPVEQARFAGAVVNRLRELENFIQGTLAFVSGRVELQEDVDLVRIVADAQRLAGPQMAAAGVTLDVDRVDGRLPLRASREALLSMLLNLLDNAQRACVRGHCVRLTLQRSGSDAVLCVADEGCGMTADTRARLFEPYFTTRNDGHGLGLAFAHSVVAAHGGRIAVDTAEGRGTQFTVSLPLAKAWQ